VRVTLAVLERRKRRQGADIAGQWIVTHLAKSREDHSSLASREFCDGDLEVICTLTRQHRLLPIRASRSHHVESPLVQGRSLSVASESRAWASRARLPTLTYEDRPLRLPPSSHDADGLSQAMLLERHSSNLAARSEAYDTPTARAARLYAIRLPLEPHSARRHPTSNRSPSGNRPSMFSSSFRSTSTFPRPTFARIA